MVHMTCKRTKTAKEDLAYMVKKFLRSEMVEPSLARNFTDSHTQTVSPDKRHLQVINLPRVLYTNDSIHFRINRKKIYIWIKVQIQTKYLTISLLGR